MKKIIYLAFLTKFVLLPTDVTGTITQRPLNAATSVNGEVSFNCSSNSAAITWLFTIECDALVGHTLTAGNCDINSSYAAHYRTENSTDGFVCNLIVFDAVLSLGGCYACSDGSGSGHNYEAMLIVVDTNANMTSNATDIVAGDDVMVSNSVSYGGPSIPQQQPPLPPQFYWTSQSDPTQNITSYKGSTTNTSASSYIIVKANPPDFGQYSCNPFFNPPTFVPLTCADNNPIYSKSWESSAQPVSYNLPPDITAAPYFESDICEAKILSCQPNAYPAAEIYWVEVLNNIHIYQQYITAEYMDEYSCVASNFFRNTSYQTAATYSLSDQGQFSLTPCQFADSYKVEIILPSDALCDNVTCNCPCCTEPVLKCFAPTLPEAQYKWLFGDTETEGPTIKPTVDGNYTCIAYNTVNNQQFAGNKSIRISHFHEFLPNSPATDETAVIVLSVFLAFSVLIIIGLVSLIVFWLLPKMRSLQESTSSGDEHSPRQAAYESAVKPNTASETQPYESLQQPTASAYQEITPRHKSAYES